MLSRTQAPPPVPQMSDEDDGGGRGAAPGDRVAGATALYAQQLLAEKRRLEDKFSGGGAELLLTKKLLLAELERIQNGGKPSSAGCGRSANEERRFADIIKEKPIKVTIRVLVPVKEHPKFNFVGKLLGPKGNSLKRLQEDTMTKMAILGRGSMRDKHKEEELRASLDPKYSHFNDDLHVEITAFAPPAEAHARIAYALAEVRKFLVPDYNDEIRQEQMREMQLLNSPLLPAAAAAAEALASERQSAGGTPPPAAKQQNGRARPLVAAAAGGFLYNQQQVLLHPAFRGLAAAAAAARAHAIPLAGAAVFPGHHPAGSIFNRLRAHPHLAAASPGDGGLSRHPPHQFPRAAAAAGGGLLSVLARGCGDQASAAAGEPLLMCAPGGAGGGGVAGGGGEDASHASGGGDLAAPTVYGLYENYAAAAAAAAAASLSAAAAPGYHQVKVTMVKGRTRLLAE
ncbi:KH domain-containing, RNA-binding, signal transduction-associated protein 1-like [Bacillus rossius redtenbacheri]|uniref:KH domain-containing, RNA-binding, signal transduction-associated protein 1-like n=1 Tax=Bacillus rossius redtenbacheri TaxID=93214 RepID=UPI002FDE9376